MIKKFFSIILPIIFAFVCSTDYANAFSLADKIAVVAAMDCEADIIAGNLKNIKTANYNNLKIMTGKIGKHKIVLVKSGIGKVNAGVTTQYVIDRYKPDYIINTGLAGGLRPGLKKGDIIIGDKTLQHDFDISVFGYAKGYTGNGINPDKPTFFHSDKYLTELFRNKIPGVHTGIIASGDKFVSDKKYKEFLKKEFDASAVDMESAAVASCANFNKVPVVIIRMISDSNSDNAEIYDNFEKYYAEKSAEMLSEILK